jgi:pilus assembly protein FimV
MAHASLGRQPHRWARLLACFAIGSSAPAFAISLGDMEIASSLGEVLDASVALAPGQGESITRECFSLGRGAGSAAPFVTRASLALETVSGGTRLHIRSTAPIGETAITLRVNAACPRGASPVSRDYVVLLDPKSGRGPQIVAPVAVAARSAPASAPAPTPAPAPKVALGAPAAEPRPSKPAPVAAPQDPAVAAATGDAFALKLSAPQIDLARARGATEQSRAQLRERQAILNSDDQVATMLALRNNVRALEDRVADLQLKISTLAAPPPVPPAPKIEVPVAKVEPAPAAPKVEPAPPPVEAVAPKPEPAPEKVESAPLRPDARPSPSQGRGLPEWLWGVVALLVLIVAWIGLRLMRRSDDEEYEPEESIIAENPAPDDSSLFDEPPFGHAPPPVSEAHYEPQGMASTPAFAPEKPPPRPPLARRTMDSDASLQTSVSAGDPSDLRRRYIEERFPEIVARTIALDESDSIVKGARLFYEDGAVPRAVELLQFAIEEKPAEVKRWLALFEIFRLERLTNEFNELASRFQDHHGTSDFWAKVQFFGREIDPSNALYQEESFNDIETAGMPASARKVQALAFDPLAENWLNAPMDFSSEVLATEMRQKLLAQAGISEAELIPNPMPALKNVEMFTVA